MNSWLKERDPQAFSRKAITVWVVALLLFVIPMDLSAQKINKHIAVSLTSDEATYVVGEPVGMTFSVKNNHKKPQKFCRYMTPFEGFYGPVLKVFNASGEAVKYKGVMVKRKEPGPEDDIELAPGEEKSVKFDLLTVYPIESEGDYNVFFPGSKYTNKLQASNEVTIHVIKE